MAKHDELDIVISNPKVEREEWEALGEILEISNIMAMSLQERQKKVNQEIRHYYGHTFVNLTRNEYEPNYVEPILIETAKKLKVTVSNHRAEDIEDKIMIKVIEIAREKIIKEKGQDAWDKIEKEIQDQLDELIRLGKIPKDTAEELLKLRGAAMIAALIGGKLAGFALYIVANQAFFAIARLLGLRIGVAVAGPIVGGALAFLLGPAGFALAGLTILYDLGNTNWKKVIPSIVMIAAIRKRLAFGF